MPTDQINAHYSTAIEHLSAILETRQIGEQALLHCLSIDLAKTTADMRSPENPLYPYVQQYPTSET